MEKKSEEENDETSLSLWLLPSDWRQRNGAEQPRVMQSQRTEERGRRKKHDCESRDREDMSDSKEERSNKTGRTLPIRLCFTSHCTAEENLSYAFALHIALTIYVLAWITQLDGCVEKTPINQILFFLFFPPFFFLLVPPKSSQSLALIYSAVSQHLM